jgi:ligand-binding sensor domain-containing protein
MARKAGLWVIPVLTAVLFVCSLLIQQALQRTWSAGSISYPGYDTVKTIALDGEGRVWVGLEGGVGVYDGQSWTTYTPDNSGLTGNLVEAIAIDKQGRTWIVTSGTSRAGARTHAGAVSILDGETWIVYNKDNSGLVSNRVEALAFDQLGRAWIGTDKALQIFDGETWDTHFPPNAEQLGYTVNSVALDSQGRAWIGTNWPSIGVYDGGTWRVYSPRNSRLNCMYFLSIAFDPQDRAWIFGHTCSDSYMPMPWDPRSGGGVNVFDGETWTAYNKANSGLLGNEIEALAFDPQGRAWIATRKGDGVSVFDGETWIACKKRNSSLVSNKVEAIAFDQKGQAWLATRKEGISVLSTDGALTMPVWLVVLRILFFSPLARGCLIAAGVGLWVVVFFRSRTRRI